MAKSINNEYVVFRATYDEDTNYDSLRIPMASITCLNMFKDETFLRDRYGNIWPVKVNVIGSAIFLFDGWKTFAKHNHLETGDSLVFWIGKHNLLDVKILGIDCSDKNGIGRPMLGRPLEKAEMQVDEGEHQGEIYETTSYSKRSAFVHRVLNKRGICLDHLGNALFKSPGEMPKNPFFVTRVRKERRGTLMVPYKIIRKYKLDLPTKICLKDSEGRKWDGILNTWKDGRKVYGNGWGPLCRENHINEEDTIICELLRSKKKGLYCIQVQVYHEGNST